jgi:hypothetical protein
MRRLAIFVILSATLLAGDRAGVADGPKLKAPTPCTEVQTCGTEGCCAHCGCYCPCQKYCCIQPTIREVKKIVWVCHCEDFCAPLPGCKRDCCCQKEEVAGQPPCRRCDPCAVEQGKCQVPPKCGKVRERKTLERKEIICKVQSYKCVVVYCCPNCMHATDAGQQPPAPPPPDAAQPSRSAPLPPPPPPPPGRTTNSQPLLRSAAPS